MFKRSTKIKFIFDFTSIIEGIIKFPDVFKSIAFYPFDFIISLIA